MVNSVIVYVEPDAEEYVRKYPNVRDTGFKKDMVEVVDVKRFFQNGENGRGCVVVTRDGERIEFSEDSFVKKGFEY